MPRQIARIGKSCRTASRISGNVVASRSGSCEVSGRLGSPPYWLGWTFEGLPVNSNPSILSRSTQTSALEPIAGIKIGSPPVASMIAFGYLSLTPWKTRSLTVRIQVGMPMTGKWREGIRFRARLVLAARSGIGVLIYK